MKFKVFKQAVQRKLQELVDNNTVLFLTAVEKDVIWDTYLDSFPPGTNDIYKERRAYDCNCCKQFLRPYGNIVAIQDNKLVSIWDIEVEGYYQEVANGLAALVKSAPIQDVFVSKVPKLGIDRSTQSIGDAPIIVWEHFYFELPKAFIDKSSLSEEAVQGNIRDSKHVCKRGLDEISLEAIESTLELIEQNSIYRGTEFKGGIEAFLKYKKVYVTLPECDQDNYVWSIAKQPAARIRNTAIGTLLVDISKGVELDAAVHKFGSKMAGYKRPKAIFSKKQVEEAQQQLVDMGFENSLERRFAVSTDITVNNVLHANRAAKKAMNVFDDLKQDVATNPKKFDKIEEVGIKDFLDNILPKASSVEVLLENKHSGNLMSLIAPKDAEALSMFKWPNGFSWAYNGDTTDSMKERVKAAGGKIDGVLRFSIQWNDGDNNQNDFDAHCKEPKGNLIYFSRMRNIRTSGNLDVDITTPGNKIAVENITWSDINKMEEGRYICSVHNFHHYGGRTGFTAEIEYDGKTYSYSYDKELKNKENVIVAEFDFTRAEGIKFVKSLDSTEISKEVWGVNTNKFQKVSMIMKSPNHWNDIAVGNQHTFFILEGCKNPTTPRGFFNEFLKDDLMKQKRVFEALGSKMKVEPSDEQLSGVGFSSTQKNSVVCKVEGAFTRTLKINF